MTFPETFPLIYEGDGRGGDQFRCKHCGTVRNRRDPENLPAHTPDCRWFLAKAEQIRRDDEEALAL